MSSFVLGQDEVSDLTGRVQHAAQAKALKAMGIEHRARPDGSIAVLRAHAEEVMSGSGQPARKKREPQINWSGVNAART